MTKRFLFLFSLLLGSVASAWAQAWAGLPDSTFNATGRKLILLPTSFYFNSLEKGVCVAKADSAHLLYLYPHSTPLSDDFGVIKTDLNGNLDPTFGTNGLTVVDVAGLNADMPAVIQVLNNRIYLGGQAGDGNVAVVCLKMNGRPDSAFSLDGKTTLDFGRTNERAVAFSLVAGNPTRLLVGVSADSSYGLAMLFANNGTLDQAFSGDGKHLLSVGKGRAYGLFYEPSTSTAYLAGYSRPNDTAYYSFTVMKVVMATTVSTIKRYRLTKGHNFCNAVAVLPNGDMYLAGECRVAATGKTYAGVFAYRFSTQAQIGTFGNLGRVLWRPPNADAFLYALKLRPAGGGQMQVLAGGLTREGSTEKAFLMRLDPNGYPDPNFGIGGISDVGFGQTLERISDIELTGTRQQERMVALGQSLDGLNWARAKAENAMPASPGWVPILSPATVNFRSVRKTTVGRFLQVTGDSARMYRLIKAEDPPATPPLYNWQRIETAGRFKTVRDFKSTAAGTDNWIVGDSGFVAVSNIEGWNNTWTRKPVSTRQRLNAVSGSVNQVGLIAGDSGLLLRSTNLGATYTKRRTATRQRLNQLFAYSYAVGDSGIILKSTDAGLTWAKRPSGTTRTLHSIASLTDTLLLAVGDSGIILRSTDGGGNWTRITDILNADTSALYSVSIGAKARLVLACGANGTILRSEDKGLTWKRQESGTARHLRSILVDDSATAICVGDSGTVLRTFDGGAYVANRPLNSPKAGLQFSLYPNPAGRQVTLSVPQAAPGPIRIEVLDLAGRLLILKEELSANAVPYFATLPLGGSPPGCYLVRVSGKAGQATRKLIVR